MFRRHRFATIVVTLSLFALLGNTQAGAAKLGIAADNANKRAVIFDTTSGTILGSVDIGPGNVGDCVIQPDENLGFVTDFEFRLWVIDLSQNPPVLAAGTNPILMSNRGQDISLGPEGRYAVACGTTHFISVIDIVNRTEVDTFDLGHSCQSVSVCTNGSVLVGELDIANNGRSLRRLLLNGNGELSDTGDATLLDFPTNVHCAPDNATGLVPQLGFQLTSVALPSLTALDTIELESTVSTVLFDPQGSEIYVRTNSLINAYNYDLSSGMFDETPNFTILDTGDFVPLGGIDTMILDSDLGHLFAAQDTSINRYEVETGTALTPITIAGSDFTGICLSASSPTLFADGFESGDTLAWSQSIP